MDPDTGQMVHVRYEYDYNELGNMITLRERFQPG